jgi:RHS repeat-associated protein
VPDYVRRGAATYRVVSDHLGSPRYVVNVADPNDVPFTASYSSFGEVTGTGLDWMPFGFAGGIYDADSGLVRFGARDADPSTGRWTQKDPIRFDGGVNVYAYAANDPINLSDPSGLIPPGVLPPDPRPITDFFRKNSPESLFNDFWNWLFPPKKPQPVLTCGPSSPDSPHPDDDPDDETLQHCQQHATSAQQACHAMGYSIEYCLRVYLYALSECLARGGRG